MNRAHILVIDDEPDMLDNCRRILSRGGHEVHTLQDPALLHEALAGRLPDVILLDLKMPQVDGMTVLAAVLAEDASLPVIIMTAFGSVASAVGAIRQGAFDYLTKPFTSDQLGVAVERAIRFRGLSRENQALRRQVVSDALAGKVIGSSQALEAAIDQVRRVAPSDASVLILGESGTGKELVARCLHALSPRQTRAFVPIDCASLPEPLLESELFGHERGAFTGAVARKRGLFAEANGGTVFLDEIGELTPAMQAKLLRTLEERRIRPVGGTVEVPVDLRLVAATNIDLEIAVREDRFRADLYYRLNVVQVRVPALRARFGDVPLLLQHFLHEFARGMSRDVPGITPEAMEALEGYSWPGNVRELRNLAQRLVVLDTDGMVTVADLPEAMRGWPDQEAKGAKPVLPYESAKEAAMEEFQRGYVRRLLDVNHGNVSRAADAAGVSRRTLHRWLADLGHSSPADAG